MALVDRIIAAFQDVAADVKALYAGAPHTAVITLDFGNLKGGGELVTATVSATWCTPATTLTTNIVPVAPNEIDDIVIDQLAAYALPGAGSFDVYLSAPHGGATGQYKVQITGVN